jgi:hypothetical protein
MKSSFSPSLSYAALWGERERRRKRLRISGGGVGELNISSSRKLKEKSPKEGKKRKLEG